MFLNQPLHEPNEFHKREYCAHYMHITIATPLKSNNYSNMIATEVVIQETVTLEHIAMLS